jgi:hypothetical protein
MIEIDVIALGAVAGGVATFAQYILHRVLAKIGVDEITSDMKQFIIAPALSFVAAVVYIGLYNDLAVVVEDLAATFIVALSASQLSYNYILSRVTPSGK